MGTVAEREALVSRWIQPSSASEKDRQDRAERMVREAVAACRDFDGYRGSIRVYTKGSYPNETNVRLDSDVDVVVQFNGCIYYDHGDGVTPPSSVAPYTGDWTPAKWRSAVQAAMTGCFGAAGIDTSGKIAIRIKEVAGSRPSADVAPCFAYHRYWDTSHTRRSEGSCVFDTSNKKIVNWPQQQLENGRAKNNRTGGRYKRYVRALKNAENALVKDGVLKALPSYFMECLVYNVADSTLGPGNLDGGFRATLVALHNDLGKDVCQTWVEPNEHKYLFQDTQPWTVADARQLVLATWAKLGYT
jgi:hypothetical protein